MSDRPQEIARKLWDVLSHEPDPRPERTVNVIATALRAYAEEAIELAKDAAMADVAMLVESGVAHWKREADTGARMLTEIHAGLGLTAGSKGGISAQDVLTRVAQIAADHAEEARREEREACAKALCPWCAGTAIKAGVFDVVSIGPAEHYVQRCNLPSAGRILESVAWRHWVTVNSEHSPFDQPCHAAAIRAREKKG